MAQAKPHAGFPLSAENQVAIPELYQQCLAAERTSTGVDWRGFKTFLVKGLITAQPLFKPLPKMDGSSAIKTKIDLEMRRLVWEGAKYRRILDLLRSQSTREDRLLLLARWLCEEQVCELDDIVETRVLQQYAKRKLARLSPTDFHHADRVRSWLPYFERLLTDLRNRKKATAGLVKMGYEASAVTAAAQKRSAVPAACEWLTGRRDAVSNVDALTLQNAFSRIYGWMSQRAEQDSTKPKKRTSHRSSQNSRSQN